MLKALKFQSRLEFFVFISFFLLSCGAVFGVLSSAEVSATPYGQLTYSKCTYGNLYCDPALAFHIRTADDTASTNECDLGMMSTTGVSTCSYRLKVTTDALLGYTISYSSSGGIDNGAYTIASAAAGNGGTGGTEISDGTAGVEGYGVVIDEGSVTGGGTVSVPAAFDAGTNAVKFDHTVSQDIIDVVSPTTATNDPGEPDLVNTSLITHKLNIAADTPGGVYMQDIVYTVLPKF